VKWSVFDVFTDLHNRDEWVIWNTLTGGIIALTKKEKAVIECEMQNLTYGELDNCPRTSKNRFLEDLARMRFIVNDDTDEKSEFLTQLNKEWENDDFLSLFVLTTTCCNFCCSYCYESSINRQKKPITQYYVDRILSCVHSYKIEKKIRQVSVVLYGGEPTTSWDVVEHLLPQLRELFTENVIQFHTDIVTNGYELTQEKISFLEEFNWKKLQVTLDGTKMVHDKRRKLINGDGTFDRIISNLSHIITNNVLEKIDLRINYDRRNITDIPELLRFLADNLGVDRLNISFGNIAQTIGNSGAVAYIAGNKVENEKSAMAYLFLYKFAVREGFVLPKFFSADGMCISKARNTLIILPNGDLYRCLSMIGRQEHKIGSVFDQAIHDQPYFFPELYDYCFDKECPFIPLCHTGCRFDALVEHGDITSIDCKQNLYFSVNQALIKFYYP